MNVYIRFLTTMTITMMIITTATHTTTTTPATVAELLSAVGGTTHDNHFPLYRNRTVNSFLSTVPLVSSYTSSVLLVNYNFMLCKVDRELLKVNSRHIPTGRSRKVSR